jgi:uncharacterized membrane protein YkoI
MTEVRMKNANGILFVVMVFLILGLLVSTGCAKKEGEAQAEKIEMEEPKPLKQEVELPAAVAEAVETNTPGAEIDFVEVAEEAGITLYDIEFKANRGEIEVAEDGTVIDVVTVVTMEEIPEAAAKAIKEAIGDAKILRMERAEVRTEIKKDGEIGTLVKLETPRYLYEAELEKDGQTGEIEVDAQGNITEPLKWDTSG